MSNAISAIQTEYNGHKFRSRLEARWAIFFDKMGLRYEYEPEGFDLGQSFYLPDFYLIDAKVHLEIKPRGYDDIDYNGYIKTLISIAKMNLGDKETWIIFGNPWLGEYQVQAPSKSEHEIVYSFYFADCRRCNGVSYVLTNGNGYGDIGKHTCGDHDRWPLTEGERITAAYIAARQARFEHGENP